MAQTRLKAAIELANSYGITLDMIDDYMRDQIIVRGRLGGKACERHINRSAALQAKDLDLLYADAHYMVINELLEGVRRNNGDEANRVGELERELTKYKAAVKDLSFKLEMANTGRAVVKESEVRKFALEQAAEFLMDHGVITTGNELVEVCEQIKKLSVLQANAAPVERWNDWKF
jgi:hypothetical protein